MHLEFFGYCCNQCICAEIQERCRQVENLAMFANFQPHAAFSTFAHCVVSECMSFMRMVPLSSDQWKPLEDVIHHQFIPAVTGRDTITEEEGCLSSLPIRDGGMDIPIPHPTSSQQGSLSHKICAPLVKAVVKQQPALDPDLAQKHASNKREAVCLQMEEKTWIKKTTVESLPSKLQRQVAIINQEGALLSCIHPTEGI